MPPLCLYVRSLRYAFAIMCLLAIGALRPSLCRADLSGDERGILSQISVDRMLSTVNRLCSDSYRGRRAGSPSEDAAGDYLAATYRGFGLSGLRKVDGLGAYRQPLTMRYSLVKCDDDIKATLHYSVGNGGLGAARTRVFSYRSYNGRGGLSLDSRVVFVGYGIHDPESGYNDFSKADVRGKIVMWLPGGPKGVKLSKPESGAQKMATAYQQGAIGCLACTSPGADSWNTNTGLAGSIADFPCLAIDRSVAAEMLSGSGVNLAQVVSTGNCLTSDGKTGARVQLRVTPVCDPERSTSNIVAVIPGSDPSVSNEIVMIGAHYDHLGDDGHGRIFRGADDNASGTSVVVEAARALMASGLRPKRTIVFASWTAEECGLVGSAYFAAHPPFSLRNIVSNIEMDMVGVGIPGSFMTTGASAYPKHYRFLAGSARDLGYSLKADAIRGASDHLTFSRRGVPTSLLYVAGVHPQYHTCGDVPSELNPKALESTARLATLAIWRAANSNSGVGAGRVPVGLQTLVPATHQ